MVTDNLSRLSKNMLLAYTRGYRVSTRGEVISPSGKIRKVLPKNGYMFFLIYQEKKTRMVFVHRLAAYQKYENNIFSTGVLVRHKNGNSLDNSLANILIGSNSDNQLDISAIKRFNRSVIATQFVRVWSDSQLQNIFDDRYKNLFNYRELKDKYNISKSTLSFLFNKSLFTKNYIGGS